MSDFLKAVEYVLDNEGRVYTNKALDFGGPTKFGITQEALSAWRHRSLSAADVENMGEDEAKQIYEAMYWKACSCEQMTNQCIATSILDTATLDGPGKASRWAQVAAGVIADGHIGPKTIEALNKISAPAFLARFIPQMQTHYIEIIKAHPPEIEFLKGWLSRSDKLLTLLDIA